MIVTVRVMMAKSTGTALSTRAETTKPKLPDGHKTVKHA
jgi:hypothetical protein